MNYKILKDFCTEKKIETKANLNLQRYTSLKIGGIADIGIFPDIKYFPELIRIISQEKIPYIILGGGTNVLIKDTGIEGVVIFTQKMNRLIYTEKQHILSIESGHSLKGILDLVIEKGLSGVEGLAGIPGSLGGAIFGNAGSFGYEIKDVIISIDVLLTDNGEIKNLKREEIGFEYRKSNLNSKDIIVKAYIKLNPSKTALVKNNISSFISEKKARQPISKNSAGCVFKNPNEISAGKLIDKAGCKNLKIGDIEVSQIHSNFFINTGKGTAKDFLILVDIVQDKVYKLFGITLELEIKIIGR